jgi:dienelactone hydrolase
MLKIKPSLCVPWGLCVLLLGSGQAAAAHPGFRPHTIDADSINSSCTVLDVNRDGRLDVVAGGWWYEAPDWKRHFVRNVEMIRGRNDDYSSLPLDVDGDGWTDLVSANYRSRSLYWVRHPGEKPGPWQRIVVDTPGPMETGRLADIDGDGRLDVLPNGTNFAAWWEVAPAEKQDADAPPRWIRHDLPREAAGHGIGFGDIDGDGRGDIVTPRGWLRAPRDVRNGRWIWMSEFQLHRDGSIPLLVFDVDDDGDNDVVWGRGHNVGLYWLEQGNADGKRTWTRHVIDTSWTEAHSLLLADIDGDGDDELVAGKRYMGHDGKDPGEYDPLVIAWYKFDKSTRAWRRGLISRAWRIGFDLDPKAADLDGDSDVDLVAPARSGLYWLENRLVDEKEATGKQKSVAEPAPYVSYEDHSKLLVFHDDEEGKLKPVTSPAEWARRRAHILAGMQQVMGRLPGASRRVPLEVNVVSEEKTEHYTRRKVTFTAEFGPNSKPDRVPAWLLIPHGVAPGRRAPAMLCLHQTNRRGKDSPAGLFDKPSQHYAHELAQRGYVCLAPDYPSFGEYQYDFNREGEPYVSGTMKAVWNNLRAVDLLESLPEVDGDRIGCIGHSLGGHNGLFTSPFDLRIRAVVTSCGFTAFGDYYGGDLSGWTSDRYMPRIRDRYENDPARMPFDFHEVVAAIAPRPVFVCAPQRDSNFDLAGVKKVVEEAHAVYKLLGADANLRAEYPDAAHDFPEATRAAAYAWLDEHLKP